MRRSPGTPFSFFPFLRFPISPFPRFPLCFRASGVPHSAQNLACDRFSHPQLGQRFWSVPPHSMQNLAFSEFSAPQLGQRMSSSLITLIEQAAEKRSPFDNLTVTG